MTTAQAPNDPDNPPLYIALYCTAQDFDLGKHSEYTEIVDSMTYWGDYIFPDYVSYIVPKGTIVWELCEWNGAEPQTTEHGVMAGVTMPGKRTPAWVARFLDTMPGYSELPKVKVMPTDLASALVRRVRTNLLSAEPTATQRDLVYFT